MKSILLFATAALAAGCVAQPDHVLQPITTTVAAAPLNPTEQSAVRRSEEVTRYEVGRYVDGAGVMHEGHPVYRLTRSATWATNNPGTGAVPASEPATYLPLPPSQELENELRAQRAVTERLRRMEVRMADMQEAANAKYRTLTDAADQAERLRAELEKERARVKDLESELAEKGSKPSAQ